MQKRIHIPSFELLLILIFPSHTLAKKLWPQTWASNGKGNAVWIKYGIHHTTIASY